MSTYAVGDIQGCYEPLRRVLDRAAFDPSQDQLWAVGDLVNRGPRSLEVLRFLRSLGDSFRGVLGNHDLHLLAVHFGTRNARPKDTLDEILAAPDREELMHWLLQLPVAHHDRGTLMVHAGIVPAWDLQDALRHAAELNAVLRSEQAQEFFKCMYGDTPDSFSEQLAGWHRLRVITNVFTRLRFCTADGQLDLKCKKGPEHAPRGMLPWYKHPNRRSQAVPILFGHWAALGGNLHAPNLFALDTACVWGQELTLLRLEDQQRFSCACPPS